MKTLRVLEAILMNFVSRFRFFEPSPLRRTLAFLLALQVGKGLKNPDQEKGGKADLRFLMTRSELEEL